MKWQINWREILTAKNILILIGSIYLISAIERGIKSLQAPEDQNEIIMQYREDKIQMEADINYWKNKSERYEIYILKNNAHIDTLNNEQLDSVWAAIPW